MEFNLETLIWMLPFAFAIHNFEEVLGMEKYTKSIPIYIHKPVSTKQFGIAVMLFSILGFIIVLAQDFYPSEKQFNTVITGFAGMLLLNVFLPHLIATIYLKKYAPGLISGIAINLPLTTLILTRMSSSGNMTIEQILLSTIIGGFIGLLLAFLFLKIGNLFDVNRRDKKQVL